jgi:two-component system chemotaxis response regulator CheY
MMKILIADDNASMRRMIRTLFQNVAEEIFECADGSEAVETYNRITPDWVLMDFGMPEMDGLTAIRLIIANDPQARVLLVTQHDDDDLRQAAREAGARGFVLKDNLFSLRSTITKNM